MTKLKSGAAALRTAMAIAIVGSGLSAASAQMSSSMGGMQMAPGSRVGMKGSNMTAMNSGNHKHAIRKKTAVK